MPIKVPQKTTSYQSQVKPRHDLLKEKAAFDSIVEGELLHSLRIVHYDSLPYKSGDAITIADNPGYTTKFVLEFDPEKLARYNEGTDREKMKKILSTRFMEMAEENGITLERPLLPRDSSNTANFTTDVTEYMQKLAPGAWDNINPLYKKAKGMMNYPAQGEAKDLEKAREIVLQVPEMEKIANFVRDVNLRIVEANPELAAQIVNAAGTRGTARRASKAR